MMLFPIEEIPITTVYDDERAGFIQIAPTGADRLPAARPLVLKQLDIRELAEKLEKWIEHPTNQVARGRLRNKLEEVGCRSLGLLSGETLSTILGLSTSEKNERTWRRVLVYTDAKSSEIPIEALYSIEELEGGEIGFVAANSNICVSVVRHLGLEAESSMEVEADKPLRMLVVFSSPQEQDLLALGSICEKAGCLSFQNHRGVQSPLEVQKRALDFTLGALVQAKLMEIHFLVGDGEESTVYRGQAQFDRKQNQLCWKIMHKCKRGESSHSLGDVFVSCLNEGDWHILHYFGHGGGSTDPELVLRPGNNLSCADISHRIPQMPRFVILNACESTTPANPDAPALTGFATLFLLRGTVSLVCMQMKVTPETATLTTRALYDRLARSLFTRQMDFEEALYEVRQLVHKGNRLDFFSPVLYIRPVEEGRVFEYRDDRMDVWKAIMGAKLPWCPKTLIKVADGCSKLIRSKQD